MGMWNTIAQDSLPKAYSKNHVIKFTERSMALFDLEVILDQLSFAFSKPNFLQLCASQRFAKFTVFWCWYLSIFEVHSILVLTDPLLNPNCFMNSKRERGDRKKGIAKSLVCTFQLNVECLHFLIIFWQTSFFFARISSWQFALDPSKGVVIASNDWYDSKKKNYQPAIFMDQMITKQLL